MTIRSLCLTALFTALSIPSVFAELRLPSVFSDHMVVQRDAEIRVWGWADAGETVSVSFAHDTVSTETDENGRWQVKLPRKVKSHKPRTMTIKAGADEHVIHDVLIGEVWIASGQSNMEWSAKHGVQPEDAKVIRSGPVDGVRLLDVPRISKGAPQDDQPAKWTLCTPESAETFSAVAYFFARQLREELDVPIGIINSSWGGTPIQPWIPVEGWEAVPSVKDKLKLPEQLEVKQRTHTALYNGMIAPLAPLSVRGFIWYQGEANRREHAVYRDHMEALITGWRTVFQNEKAPFYFVQLAPFIYGKEDPTSLPAIQNAQRLAAETIPNTGMAVTTDIGDLKDIHPKNKSEVGRRLSLLALANAYTNYGIEAPAVSEGPLPVSATVLPVSNLNDPPKVYVRVTFKNLGEGWRSSNGDDPDYFELAGRDGVFHRVHKHSARIDPSGVMHLSSPEVKDPKQVRYLWNQEWITNLQNSAGLPASPFLIDVEPME